GPVAVVDRHVLAEAEHAELIDPGVVAGFRAAPIRHPLELWQRLGIEGPPLGTMLARRGRSVERSLALAAIEAGQMPAGECRPIDAIPIHGAAAGGEPLDRHTGPVERELVPIGE